MAYIGIRKKQPLDERQWKVITAVKEVVRSSPFRDFAEDLILYGSAARGSFRYDSDVDLLLVLRENAKEIDDFRDAYRTLRGRLMVEEDGLPKADVHTTFGEGWKAAAETYYQEVRRDGRSVWD